jgi:membrane-bound lytic murein transglycosylase B
MRSRIFLAACAATLVLCSLASAHAQVTSTAQRAALQAQLDQIENDIASNQTTLTELQGERTSLERDIAILDNQIQTAQLQIKQSDLTLQQLASSIADKEAAITQVDGNVAQGQQSLAQILRATHEIDDTSIATLILSTGSISDVFQDVDNFETLQKSLSDSFTQMAALRSDLASREQALQEQQDEAQKIRDVQVLAKQSVQSDEQQKQSILTETKGQEAAYQQIIADKQTQAAQIRVALFGLRDTGAIPFGTAYQYAKEASALTGVRPALILAILTEETDLGANQGSCNWLSAMPPRDIAVFPTLMSELGLDPNSVKVSCKPSYGWGGAMGPAQFIPSTWMLYESRIAKITGQNPPNPWDGRTAIFAAALLMADNGADAGTRAAERLAALRYFAGWGNANKAAFSFYGQSVMSIADSIQANIDILNG